ncbi:LYR motif-containing protein 5A [Dissostichus eleginoides]|uniref:LYR motif-containing protein 5A n=1 Tax=Dissostichus eleginoides TaxID=100907 RepID=A0AAD9CR90_DISEL|nr:LYR motif-containing protein 5A [Dissostichus eleginoides]
MANHLKEEVMKLYKTLLYLGREYPQGAAYFRGRLKSAFMKNKDEKDPEKIQKLVARGDFVIKELEALYFLRKYRAMKKRYFDPEKKSDT